MKADWVTALTLSLLASTQLASAAVRTRDAFTKEVTQADARFEIVVYPGAKHAFTQPYAREANIEGIAYDADADRQTWAAMLALLAEVYP